MCVRELFVQIPRLHVLQLLSCDSDSNAARYCTNEQWHWLTSAENCCFTTITTHVFTCLISFEFMFESYRDFSSSPCLKWSKLNMSASIEIHCSLIWFANTLGLTIWVDYDSERKGWHLFLYFSAIIEKRVQNFAQWEIYVNHFIDPFKHSLVKWEVWRVGKKYIFRQTKI